MVFPYIGNVLIKNSFSGEKFIKMLPLAIGILNDNDMMSGNKKKRTLNEKKIEMITINLIYLTGNCWMKKNARFRGISFNLHDFQCASHFLSEKKVVKL